MTKTLIINIIWGSLIFLDIFSKVPQIIRLLRRKESEAISLSSNMFYNLFLVLYIIYAILVNDILLAAESGFALCLNVIITILSFKYRR